VEREEYDDLLRTLVRTMAHQQTINDDLREFNRQQLAVNERLAAAIERLDVTQARIETLLARVLRTEANGRDA
jgi:hypothetical protein